MARVTKGPHCREGRGGGGTSTATQGEVGLGLGVIKLECRFHTLLDNEIKDVLSEAGIPAIPFPPTGLCFSDTETKGKVQLSPSLVSLTPSFFLHLWNNKSRLERSYLPGQNYCSFLAR